MQWAIGRLIALPVLRPACAGRAFRVLFLVTNVPEKVRSANPQIFETGNSHIECDKFSQGCSDFIAGCVDPFWANWDWLHPDVHFLTSRADKLVAWGRNDFGPGWREYWSTHWEYSLQLQRGWVRILV